MERINAFIHAQVFINIYIVHKIGAMMFAPIIMFQTWTKPSASRKPRVCSGFLNLAQTSCISSCAAENAGSNPDNQCTLCSTLDPLSSFVTSACACVPGASGSVPNCACKQGFSTAGNACTCSKKISSDWATCTDKCPTSEVFLNSATTCTTCSSEVPNVDQTACVAKVACSPGFLNLAGTFCIADCAAESSGANAQNQCQSCESINALSVFKVSGCACLPRATGSVTSCSCNTVAGFSGPGCTCSGKISSDGAACGASCPAAEVFLAGASQCSTCVSGLVPNVDQTACVAKTACAPGFLNLAQTSCISSCAAENAGSNPDNQCTLCSTLDPLSSFVTSACACVPGASGSVPNCACKQGFSTAGNACTCSKKISSDWATCTDKCPTSEVFLNSATTCTTCSSEVPNVDQTACVAKVACSPGFLNLAGTFCIADCAAESSGANAQNQCQSCESINALSVFKVSGCACLPRATGSVTSCSCNTVAGFSGPGCTCSGKISSDGAACGASCPAAEVFLAGASQCSTCVSGLVPNVDQTACVAKTACAPGFLNLAQTSCISSCAAENAGSNPDNQCTLCSTLDPLSSFVTSACACVPGASGSVPNCACKQGFSTAGNACTCSKKISSDWATCTDKCPTSEVFLNSATTCTTCSSEVPNVDQTACVAKVACSPGFLNLAGTFCIADCAAESSGANAQNQCQSCESINALSVFKVSGCACLPRATGSVTSCSCNTVAGFSGPGCTCSGKISSDGAACGASCPAAEVFLAGASQCSTCGSGLVPNVDQTACVAKTACAPGFLNQQQTFCIASCAPLAGSTSFTCVQSCDPTEILTNFVCSKCQNNLVPNLQKSICVSKTGCSPNYLNVEQTFCISSCSSQNAVQNALNQCQTCSQVNILATWVNSQCQCSEYSGVFPSCKCNEGFIKTAQNKCECTDLISISETCVKKCHLDQISVNNKCTTCPNSMANVQQSACVTDCTPFYISADQKYCVSTPVCDITKNYLPNLLNNKCVCKNSLSEYGGQCSECDITKNFSPNQVNNQCICTKDFVQLTDFCYKCSGTGQIIVDQQCECRWNYKIVTINQQVTCEINAQKQNKVIGGVISGVICVVIVVILIVLSVKRQQKTKQRYQEQNVIARKIQGQPHLYKIVNPRDRKIALIGQSQKLEFKYNMTIIGQKSITKVPSNHCSNIQRDNIVHNDPSIDTIIKYKNSKLI
ncbi:putative [Hexamita inflata]|uniref:Putative n=1 Tax=Hexamita inflata TaxID=28002 RepID=A0AA86RJB8_9EUKA|nr:putative [Hexamita inflata]